MCPDRFDDSSLKDESLRHEGKTFVKKEKSVIEKETKSKKKLTYEDYQRINAKRKEEKDKINKERSDKFTEKIEKYRNKKILTTDELLKTILSYSERLDPKFIHEWPGLDPDIYYFLSNILQNQYKIVPLRHDETVLKNYDHMKRTPVDIIVDMKTLESFCSGFRPFPPVSEMFSIPNYKEKLDKARAAFSRLDMDFISMRMPSASLTKKVDIVLEQNKKLIKLLPIVY